jgi:hypothetical protein
MATFVRLKRIFVRQNSAGSVLAAGRLNLIDGNGVAAVVADDSANEELDVTLKLGAVTVEAHTADDTLTAAETGSIHTNTAAAGTVILTLPPAAAGLVYHFYVDAAQVLTIDAATGDTIQVGTTAAGSSGGTLSADAVGESISLVAINATEWVTLPGTAAVGTWTAA